MPADDRSIRHLFSGGCMLAAAVARWPWSGVSSSLSPDVTPLNAATVCLPGAQRWVVTLPVRLAAWLSLSHTHTLSLFSSTIFCPLEHHAVPSMAGNRSPLLRNTRGHQKAQGPASTSDTSISNQFSANIVQIQPSRPCRALVLRRAPAASSPALSAVVPCSLSKEVLIVV